MLCQKCYFNDGCVVSFEIKHCDPNSSSYSAQDHLHYSGFFVIPYGFWDWFVDFAEYHWDSGGDDIQYVDHI